MSRVGKNPISIPEGVAVTIEKSIVTVKGPKGELTQPIHPDIKMNISEDVITFDRPTEQKRHKALHGLTRALVNNMVVGVTDGYKKEMELVGVGYKASNQGNVLELSLGYSHNVVVQVPEELKLATETQKGKNPRVTLEGIDKQLIGQVAAKIRSLRKVEPYKGKGIRFLGEQVRRKAGKTAAK